MVYILLGTGFEEMEAICPCDILRRGGVEVKFAGVTGKSVTGANGITVEADCLVSDIKLVTVGPDKVDMIVVPGGMGGVESIAASQEALDLISAAYSKGVEVAAICAGPRVLGGLGILEGREAVCYPGMEDQIKGAKMTQRASVIRSDNVTTGRGPGASMDFGLALLETMGGRTASKAVAGEMHYGVK